MIKTKLDRVRVKDEKGVGVVIILVFVVLVVLIFLFLVLPAVQDYECRDCDDVWKGSEGYAVTEYGTKVKVFGDEEATVNIRYNYQPYDEEYWELDWFDYKTPGGWHFQTETYDSLSEMEDAIDSIQMPGDQNEGFHHIIDCIQRGCK